MLDRHFIRRVCLVLFVVFAGLQNILTADALAKHGGPNYSDECQRELGRCTLRAALPYIVVNTNEALAKARATPFAKHCTDWGAAALCNRQKLRSEACLNATSADTKQIIKFAEALDLVVNYACKENFQKFSRIYHCLLDPTVHTRIGDQCKDLKFNETDVCEKMPRLIECSAEAISARCGSGAGNTARELVPKLWVIVIEATYGQKCSPSKRDGFSDMMKRYFFY